MIWYNDKNYGADIDGNRGISVWEYEWEKSDDEWVIPLLQDLIEDSGYLPNEVSLFTPEEDCEVTLDTADYKYLEARFEVWEGEQFIEGGLLLEEAEAEYDESFDIKYNRTLED
jgi:hypothetical protein